MSNASSTALLDPPATLCRTSGALALPKLVAPAAPPAVAPAAAKPRRDADLDAMRFLASAGVVWVHAAVVTPSGVGRFAVPMYIVAAILLTAFSLRKRPDQSLAGYLGARWVRLYPAFLFWCVIYEAFRQTKWLMRGGLSNVHVDPLDFIGGTYEHLWYLPYLLVASVLAVPVLRLAIRDVKARRAIGIGTAIVGFTWATLPVPKAIASIPPESPWLFLQPVWWATPSLFLAIALACVALQRGAGLTMPRSLGLLGLAMFAAGAWVNWSVLDQPHLLAATLSGIGAIWFAGAGLMPRGLANALGPLGATLGLGIYLSHVLFLRVCVMVAERAQLMPSHALDVASFAVALSGAIALSTLLRRSRWTRWVIGM